MWSYNIVLYADAAPRAKDPRVIASFVEFRRLVGSRCLRRSKSPMPFEATTTDPVGACLGASV